MSIASEITRLQSAKSTLKTKLNAKNDEQHQITDKTLDEYGDFVDSIPTGGGLPEKGFVLEDYGSDGFPTKARFVGSWTGTLPIFMNFFKSGTILQNVKNFEVPNGITMLPNICFHGCVFDSLKLPDTLTTLQGVYTFYNTNVPEITLPASCTTFTSNQQFVACQMSRFIHLGQMPNIPNSCFASCNKCELYDFSHCSTIPTLYSAASLGHKANCVIKVPQSLLSTWQTSTNWSSLSDVVWEGV